MLTAGLATPRATPCILRARDRATAAWPGEEGPMSWKLLLVIIGAPALGAYYLSPQLRHLLPVWLR